jgi:TonB family protein
MNATVLYSLQSILSAGVFILIYRLFVRNTNAYNWNRFYLLSTMIISLFLPHINISNWFTVEKPILIYASMIDLGQAISITPSQQVHSSFTASEIIMTSYWVITGLFLLRFGWGILRIIKLVINNNYKKSSNLRLYPIQRKTTFSFFNYIFIQPDHWDKPVTEYIIRHEEAHVKNMHSLDNLLTELILVFGWFNPFYYIYRRDLHLLHECQADQVVINSGCDKTTYHQLLLNEVSGNLTYIIVNQFSYSLIKRRFKMISKNKQSRLAGFRILLAIPTAFALLVLFSFTSLEKTTSLLKNNILQPTMQAVQSSMDNLQNPQQKTVTKQQVKSTIKFTPPVIKQDTTKKSTIKFTPPIILSDETISLDEIVVTAFSPSSDENSNNSTQRIADRKPEFPGGYSALGKFLRDNIRYPAEALKGKITGTVYVQFNVSKTGQVQNAKILRNIGKPCDDEALRIIHMMPLWSPCIKDGKAVNSIFCLPIKFQLATK